MKGMARKGRDTVSSKHKISRQTACHNMSTLSDDSLSTVVTAGEVEVPCLELVISTRSVDS